MVPGMLHSNVLNRIVAIVAFGVSVGLAPCAQARVFIGFGFPFYIGSPAYYPPPIYYPPPAPRPAAPSGQSCYAGAYVCPMDRPVASGSACYGLSNDRTHIPGRAG
jgi:hypothetical protein